MKRRIFSILVCTFFVVAFFVGCNTFSTDPATYYNQVVARVEGTNVEITKEQLINSYYNYGSQLVQQGYTTKEALAECVKQLVNREYMLSYLKAEAKKEKDNASLTEEDWQYELTKAEVNQAVKDTWKYIDEQLSTIAKDMYGTAGELLPGEEKTPDFAAQTEYVPTLALVQDTENENVYHVYKYVDPEKPAFTSEEPLDEKSYVKKQFANDEQTTAVFEKYIEKLKESQKSRGQKVTGVSTNDILQREIKRLFEINHQNAYLNKFQTVFANNYGFGQDGKLTEQTIQKILDKYKEKYSANKEQADLSPSGLGSAVVAVGGLANYVYYGTSENFFSVMHILVQFTEEQKAIISDIESSPYFEGKEELIAQYRSIEYTKVFLRDNEGFKTENSVTVSELNGILQALYNEVKTENLNDTSTDKFASDMAKRFNDLIYVYGEDGGMINPTYDYVMGTTSSGMVEAFTEEGRDLYAAGQRGAISGPVETEYGYHFIMLVGELNPIVGNPGDISVELLDRSMRLSGGKTHLETLLAEVASADFNVFQQRLINGFISGIKIIYHEDRYKDLYE